LDGQQVPEALNNTLVVTAEQLVFLTADGSILRQAYHLDPAYGPKTLDVTDRGEVSPGIYHLDGDELKICSTRSDSAKTRPADFATPPGSGHYLLTLKRQERARFQPEKSPLPTDSTQ